MVSPMFGGGGGGLHIFSIGDIPVRVSLWYGLLMLFWFQGGLHAGAVILAIVVTLSILFHELGHALVARHYGLRPQILLHGLGGLCAHDRAESDRHDVFIIAAGPGFGLALGILSWGLTLAFADALMMPKHRYLAHALETSIYVNVIWSFVNLVPLWPLDGGQLFRIFMLKVMRPLPAERVTHIVAIVLLVVGGGVALFWMQGGLMVMVVLWLAWANIQAMRQGGSGPVRTTSRQAKKLLAMADSAFDAQDFKAAARFCHLIRDEQNVHPKVMKECWRILGVSSARLGDHEDGLSYLRRAPMSLDVLEAKVECLYALGYDEDLKKLLAGPDFAKLPGARRAEILSVVQG